MVHFLCLRVAYIDDYIIFQHIPLVVETCAGIVETRGLENQGIYRVPGNTSVVNFLQAELDRVRFIYTYVPVHIYTVVSIHGCTSAVHI